MNVLAISLLHCTQMPILRRKTIRQTSTSPHLRERFWLETGGGIGKPESLGIIIFLQPPVIQIVVRLKRFRLENLSRIVRIKRQKFYLRNVHSCEYFILLFIAEQCLLENNCKHLNAHSKFLTIRIIPQGRRFLHALGCLLNVSR